MKRFDRRERCAACSVRSRCLCFRSARKTQTSLTSSSIRSRKNFRERRYGWRGKEGANRQIHAERFPNALDQMNQKQAIAAEIENQIRVNAGLLANAMAAAPTEEELADAE